MHLQISRRKEASNHYFLDGIQVQTVNSAKDLGIILTSDLKWKQHIARIQQKAFFVAYRIFYSFTSRNWYILLKAFKSFVLPILEHNSIIWSSHLKGDIHKIESVQRFFTKKLFRRCGIGSNGYEDRLSKLSIRSLEQGCTRWSTWTTSGPQQIWSGPRKMTSKMVDPDNILWTMEIFGP